MAKITNKISLNRLTYLKDKKKKLEERLYRNQLKEHEKIANIGWGSSMRGYKRIARLNLNKSSEISEKINLVDIEIKGILESLDSFNFDNIVYSTN